MHTPKSVIQVGLLSNRPTRDPRAKDFIQILMQILKFKISFECKSFRLKIGMQIVYCNEICSTIINSEETFGIVRAIKG